MKKSTLLIIILFAATSLYSQYINPVDRKVYTDTTLASLYTGELLVNYENGHTKNKWNYKNGVIDGESILYYENGQIFHKWNYIDGVPQGESVQYYENGQIKEKTN